MIFLKRDAIAARVVGATLEKPAGGFSARSFSPQWERRAATDEDVARVRSVLGDDAAGGRIVPFVISTPRRADDQIVLPPSGCSLDRFNKNPSVFWQHRWWSDRTRIGDAVAWIDGDEAVRALVSFMQRDLSDVLDRGFSWALGELAARRGHACSIGFDILSAVAAPDEVRKNMPWAIDALAWVLLELSLANIGADEDAISEGRAAGVDVSPLAHGFSQLLDTLAAGGIDREQIERAWSAAASSRARHFVGTTAVQTTTPPPAVITAAEVSAALSGAFGQLLQA